MLICQILLYHSYFQSDIQMRFLQLNLGLRAFRKCFTSLQLSNEFVPNRSFCRCN